MKLSIMDPNVVYQEIELEAEKHTRIDNVQAKL